ncbi:MAG TPA: hypothetical protein VNT56_00450 [Acidimicrobiales bacterium]|nr:hypothetical protein [Acidimicrobiales bacterium]
MSPVDCEAALVHRHGSTPVEVQRSYVAPMSILHIEHPITDFETWAAAFHRFADARHDAGVRSHRVLRPVDDPCYVVVDLEFDTDEAALTFRQFLQTVIWAAPENAPALAGDPHAVVLRAEQM